MRSIRGGLAEFLEIYFAITVGVSNLDHLVDDIVSDFLTKSGQELSELVWGDDSVFVGIHDIECFSEFSNLG